MTGLGLIQAGQFLHHHCNLFIGNDLNRVTAALTSDGVCIATGIPALAANNKATPAA
jgi:hypothetical protein